GELPVQSGPDVLPGPGFPVAERIVLDQLLDMVQVLGEMPVEPADDLVCANEQVRMALRPRRLLCARRRIVGGGAVDRVAVVLGNGDLVRGRRRGAEIVGGARLAAGGERSGGKKGRKDRGDLHRRLPPGTVRQHDTRAWKRVKDSRCSTASSTTWTGRWSIRAPISPTAST